MWRNDYWWRECLEMRGISDRLAPLIIVVTTSFPADNRAGEIILRKLLALLGSSFKNVWVVAPAGVSSIVDAPEWVRWLETRTTERGGGNIFSTLTKHLLSQLEMAVVLSKLDLKNTPVVFWNAGILIVPNVCARVRKAVNIVFRFGACSVAPRKKYPGMKGWIISSTIRGIEALNLYIARYMAVENKAMIGIGRYAKKAIEISLYVNVQRFKRVVPISERSCDALYLGRLAPEKGIEELLEALDGLSSLRPEIRLRVIGNGVLKEKVERSLKVFKWASFSEWMEHEELPAVMNQAKLLLVPSDTEGLPNVVLEGMACGTLPLATAVGGIPGVVIDGENGWLLESNSPEAICKGIDRALSCTNLSEMSRRAEEFIGRYYSFHAANERLRSSLKAIGL